MADVVVVEIICPLHPIPYTSIFDGIIVFAYTAVTPTRPIRDRLQTQQTNIITPNDDRMVGLLSVLGRVGGVTEESWPLYNYLNVRPGSITDKGVRNTTQSDYHPWTSEESDRHLTKD